MDGSFRERRPGTALHGRRQVGTHHARHAKRLRAFRARSRAPSQGAVQNPGPDRAVLHMATLCPSAARRCPGRNPRMRLHRAAVLQVLRRAKGRQAVPHRQRLRAGRKRELMGAWSLHEKSARPRPSPGNGDPTSSRLRSRLDEDDWSFASLQQIKSCSRCLAQIDDAITNLRAAVVDAYDHLPAILGIAHAHAGAKRKCPVSRSQIVHVETLTARRALSVKARPVP
jgi:hypothetical protein